MVQVFRLLVKSPYRNPHNHIASDLSCAARVRRGSSVTQHSVGVRTEELPALLSRRRSFCWQGARTVLPSESVTFSKKGMISSCQ